MAFEAIKVVLHSGYIEYKIDRGEVLLSEPSFRISLCGNTPALVRGDGEPSECIFASLART